MSPDLTDRTSWIGRSRELAYDPETSRIFAINMDEKLVFEADLEGTLVRTYGRAGEGPGELENPLELVVAKGHLAVLDLGNMKLARFPRDGSEPVELHVSHYYRDLAAGNPGELLVLPGRDTLAVDILDWNAEPKGGFGSRSTLPGLCFFCLLRPVGKDAVLLVDTETPALTVLGRDGVIRRQVDFRGMEVMRRWQREEAEILGRRPDLQGGKVWISDAAVVAPEVILLTVTPPRPFDRGRELWKVDLRKDLIRRYRYGGVEAGVDIAVAWPRLFTTGAHSGAILEYRLPEDGHNGLR